MANTIYANKIVESVFKDNLTTAINTRNYVKLDTMNEGAGMTKSVNTYVLSGAPEVLANGVGNAAAQTLSYTTKDYTVQTLQGRFAYTDEDAMKDPEIVDGLIKAASNQMMNTFNAAFFAAADTATNSVTGPISYEKVVDAISACNVEDESKLVLFVSLEDKAKLRKDADYKAAQLGEVIYNGQVGVIGGVPVVASKAVTTPFIASTDAITLFLKKDVEVEQHRDANTRTNEIYLRAFFVEALTDATKICKIATA